MERRKPIHRDAGKRPASRTAREDALHLLRRRPRTRAELSHELQRRGHALVAIDETLAALESSGIVNDTDLARHYVATRAARLGHGRERLLAELERRGVAREQAERAWKEAVDSGEVAPLEQLRAAVRRRVQGRGKLDSKSVARVYNALLRAGFGAEEIRRELQPYQAAETSNTLHDDGTNDDFP